MIPPRRPLLLAAAALAGAPFVDGSLFPGEPPPRFAASSLPLSDDFGGPWPARIDGDGLLDLVAAAPGQGGSPRELQVRLQRPDGSFPPVPDRRVSLKADVVAISLADVRPDPGEEILLFTASSCFSYSTAQEGYAGNARRVFSWDLLADVPDERRVLFVPAGPPAPKVPPILALPGPEGYGLFGSRGAEEGMGLLGTVRQAMHRRTESPQAPREFRIGVHIEQEEPFKGVLLQPPAASGSLAGRFGRDYLESSRWLPGPILADVDGDKRSDLLLLVKERAGRMLHLHLQDPAGRFPADPSWSGALPGEGSISAVDLDGDGRADLLSEDSEDFGEEVVKLYRNRGAAFEGGSPDQVLKVSGMGLEARVLDLDRDRRPELVLSAWGASGGGPLGGGRLLRRLLVYRPEAPGLFARRPCLKHEETLGETSFHGMGNAPDLEGDLLGRGLHDVLTVEGDGTLAVRHLTPDLDLEREPFFRFTPEKLVLGVEVLDLNADGRSDIVLRHRRAVTVLVSRR